MTEFLIVCPTPKRADALFRSFLVQLQEKGGYVRAIKGRRVIITEDVLARFITEDQYYEASRGFKGLIVSGYEVERALDNYIKTGGMRKC